MAKSPSVPYCTVKGFRSCLDILRRERPDVVDRQALVDRGMSPHAVYPVIGALRFLGIVDEAGKLTSVADAFLGDDFPQRRLAVETCYAEILGQVSFPVADREDVDRLLVEKHDVAPGVAAFCSTFFLWLAAESGMPVAELGRSRRGRPPAHLSQLSDAARSTLIEQEAQRAGSALELDGAFAPARNEPAPRPAPALELPKARPTHQSG